jgi:signal transduction histidine kinase
VQDQSEPPFPPFRFDGVDGPAGRHHWRRRHAWHADDDDAGWQSQPDWRGPGRRQRLRHRGDGQPLRRDPQDRLLGGVAAGIAEWRGFNPTTVRIVLAVVGLWGGWAIPLYFIAWLLIPARDSETSIGARARHDSRGIALAIGIGSLLCVILLVAGVLNSGAVANWGWPQVISVVCLTLIWRNAPDSEQAAMRHLVEPLESLGTGGGTGRRLTVIRLGVSLVLLAAGAGWLLTSHEKLSYLVAPVGGVLLVAGGLVLLLGPWWLRIARDLVLERQARARAEERADMASRLHDSVLQTLALIQRRADDPQQVVQLARVQERELRSWLFEGRAPGEADATSFADGIRQIQRDVEARHGVPVEVVTVGDCVLDDDIGALLLAAREATVNAAKWSGASVISLYGEVEPDKLEVAVRDRGKGFDPDSVAADRKGLAESIHGRMARHGGAALVNSAPGEGTKVTLTLPRTAASAAAAEGRRR